MEEDGIEAQILEGTEGTADSAVIIAELPWEGGPVRDVKGCPWVVKFFHPECGGCRALAPPYQRLALRARKERLPCIISTLDCRAHQDYCVSHNAVEYPLVKVWDANRVDEVLSLPDADAASVKEEAALEDALWKELRRVCVVPGGEREEERCASLAAAVTSAPGGHAAAESSEQMRMYSADVVWVTDLRNALHFVLSSGIVEPENLHQHVEDVDVAYHGELNVAQDGEEKKTSSHPAELDAIKTKLIALASHVFPSKLVREQLRLVHSNRDLRNVIKYLRPFKTGADEAVKWRGCSGSSWNYRGLPCALWQLFHTLLTGCIDAKCKTDLHIDALGVIRGWIVKYFNCGTCRRHFGEGSAGWDTLGMSETEQALTLWRFHNVVNRRLAGDLSDDPTHRKMQFPSRELCRWCYRQSGGTMQLNEDMVLSFLIDFYPRVGHNAASGQHYSATADGAESFINVLPYFVIFVALWIPLRHALRRYRYVFLRYSKSQTPAYSSLEIV